jgi:hypothetical protein
MTTTVVEKTKRVAQVKTRRKTDRRHPVRDTGSVKFPKDILGIPMDQVPTLFSTFGLWFGGPGRNGK